MERAKDGKQTEGEGKREERKGREREKAGGVFLSLTLGGRRPWRDCQSCNEQGRQCGLQQQQTMDIEAVIYKHHCLSRR